jgi:predicted NAD/FAD-binding protein
MKARPKVAIIGAGWAGLAAAVELADQAELTCLRPVVNQADGPGAFMAVIVCWIMVSTS